jgi:hypothetical protein
LDFNWYSGKFKSFNHGGIVGLVRNSSNFNRFNDFIFSVKENKMCQLSNDTRTLNTIISNIVGCNIEGRIDCAMFFINQGDIEQAKSELNALLKFIKGE